jgi:hypothetical protein
MKMTFRWYGDSDPVTEFILLTSETSKSQVRSHLKKRGICQKQALWIL